mgnify:FL=1
MSKIQVNTAQIGIISGIRQDQTDFALEGGRDRPSRILRSRGKLWILTQPACPSVGATTAAKLVMETVEESYYTSNSPTITGALEEAINQANRLMYEYNSGAPIHKQAYLGISCIVLHDQEVYIAQVQPAAILVIHGGEVSFFPPDGPLPEEELTPLGLEQRAEVELHRSGFRQGDTMVALSTDLASALYESAKEEFLYDDYEAIIDKLFALSIERSILDGHALVVEFPDSPNKRPISSNIPSWQSISTWVQNKLKIDGHLVHKGSKDKHTLNTDDQGWPIPLVRIKSSNGFWTSAGRILNHRFQSRALIARTASIIGIVLIFALAMALGARAFEGFQRANKVENLLSRAQKEISAAHNTSLQEAVRHLQNAQSLVADAEKIDPSSTKIAVVRAAIQSNWEKVRKIEHLKNLRLLGTVPGLRTSADAKIILLDNKVVVLNKDSGRVYIKNITGGGPGFISPSRSVRFIGISWREGGLLILDRAGRLFDYDFTSGRWTQTRLGGNWDWDKVTGFDTYGTRAYVSLKGFNGILEYDIRNPGAASIIRGNRKGITFSSSSLGADGNVWALSPRDGSLIQITDGKINKKLWIEASPPVTAPFGIVALDTNQHLYFLDEGRDRILEMSADGQLVAQLIPDLPGRVTGNISAVFVDEANAKLILLAGNKLYYGKLPSS